MFGGSESLAWATDLLLGLAVLGCAYLAICWVLVLHFAEGDTLQRPPAPRAVSILVPLCGAEPGLGDRIRRLRDQDYPAPIQIVCGTASPDDPAVDVVKRIAAEAAPRRLEESPSV